MDPLEVIDVLNTLMARRPLSEAAMRTVMRALLGGGMGDVEAGAILIALRMRGETAEELASAAMVLREHMFRWDPGRPDVLDTCGTGGDGAGTFNISTATALVVAGCGVPVVKHGNRAVSGRSGSADVLAALGVKLDEDAAAARRRLDRAGVAFCFAPAFHPGLKRLADLRRRLGVATLFNWLGPLASPAGAAYQLVGVGRPQLLDPLAGALGRLGVRRAFVVRSRDGLDEVSLSETTDVREVRDAAVVAHEWVPEDFGLGRCGLEVLRAADASASAAMIEEVLHGRDGAPRRVVLANAAAALLAAQRVADLRTGVTLARDALDSRRALRVLEILRESD